MSKARDIIRKIINAVSVIIIICSLIMLVSVVFISSDKVPDFMGYSVFRITTGSMEPTLRTGSFIIVHKVSAAEVKQGDIITFYSQTPELQGAVNTHRVIEIVSENSQPAFRTKGDANVVEDSLLTYEKDLIGVVVYSSYTIGVLVRLASNPLIFLPVIFLPLLAMLIVNLTKTVKMMGKALDEDAQKELEKRKNGNEKPDDEKTD